MYQDEGTASTRNAKYVLGGVESSERAHAAVYDLTDLAHCPTWLNLLRPNELQVDLPSPPSDLI